MRWIDVEEFVLEQIKQRLENASAANPAEVYRQFREAYEPLKDFEKNISYDLPLTGEAYALKYHLQRMDNMKVALNRVHNVRPLLASDRNFVLDIGSGTGASAMGFMRWLNSTCDVQQKQVKVTLCEPSEHMRIVSEQLVPAFKEKLGLGPNSQFSIYPRNLEECAQKCEREDSPFLDLAIFCYTFWIQRRDEWPSTTKHVLEIAKAVKPNGTLVFLTPKSNAAKPSYQKVLFMQHLKRELVNAGFNHLEIDSPSGYHPGQSTCVQRRPDYDAKWPKPVCDLISQMLQSPPLEGNDRPYYSFSATIDAFSPKDGE